MGPSAGVAPLDAFRVPSLRGPLASADARLLLDPFDESMERLDVRDVLPAQPREPRADLLVVPYAVRREAVPQLPSEASASDIPVGQDDRLAVTRRDGFAQGEDRRAFVHEADVAEDAEGPQRPPVVLSFDDDRGVAAPLLQFLDRPLEVLVQSLPVHQKHALEARRPTTARILASLKRRAANKDCVGDAIIYGGPDMRIVPGEEDVNFERVTKVYREESGKKTLVSLEAAFYDKLAAYVVRLDEAANKEAQKDPNSPKALLLQDELRKVRKRRDQIFTYRERKLALLASSRASGADVEIPNLPAQERTLFESMVAVLKKARAESFGGSPFGSEPAAPPPEPGPPAKDAPAKETPRMKVVRAEETRRTPTPPSLRDHVLVHVLEDLPPFAGIDTTYRLKKEDVITLPRTIAQILVDRGKARIIQVGVTG